MRFPAQNVVDPLAQVNFEALAALLTAAEEGGGLGGGGNVRVIVHGADAEYERPENVEYVIWIGTVEPENAIEYDSWKDIT